jgi:hypothetical protein
MYLEEGSENHVFWISHPPSRRIFPVSSGWFVFDEQTQKGGIKNTIYWLKGDGKQGHETKEGSSKYHGFMSAFQYTLSKCGREIIFDVGRGDVKKERVVCRVPPRGHSAKKQPKLLGIWEIGISTMVPHTGKPGWPKNDGQAHGISGQPSFWWIKAEVQLGLHNAVTSLGSVKSWWASYVLSYLSRTCVRFSLNAFL